MNRIAATLALLLPLLLIGCGDAGSDAPGHPVGGSEEPLPAPDATGGDSVTGMPDEPGPDPAPSLPAPPRATLPVGAQPPPDGAPPDRSIPDGRWSAGAPQGPAPPAPLPPLAEPTAADAMSVVRDYYAAIAAGDFGQAYALWGDGGRASGQSPRQFAAGFADVASLSVEVIEPGRVEPAAGSRFIEVPVALDTVHRDGSRHRYVGAYTLRRSVVDGASDNQRAWRLHSADIREVRF